MSQVESKSGTEIEVSGVPPGFSTGDIPLFGHPRPVGSIMLDVDSISTRGGLSFSRHGPCWAGLRLRQGVCRGRLGSFPWSLIVIPLVGFTLLAARQANGEQWGELKFNVAEATVLGEKGGRLRIYYGVPYDQLRFLSREGEYVARIYVTAVCLDRDGAQKAGEIWERRILVDDYEETKLKTRVFLDSLSLPVDPGQYTLRVEIRDRHSQRRGSRELEVLVRDLKAEGLEVSDLHFLRLSQSTLLFNPARIYDGSSPLVVSFEVYRSYPSKTPLSEHWRVEDQGGNAMLKGVSSSEAPEDMNTEVLKVPLDSLGPGEYSIVVSVEDEERRERRETRGAFKFQPPAFLSDTGYQHMVEQLEYIASSSELRRLKEAAPEERQEMWDEFWKGKDPSPGTERNEARDEYFRRVEYANRYFSGFREGWRTDMGRIYIIYGGPDDIERHPFDLDSPPYEVWYYYGEGLKFVFVDEHGLGDYKLVYPREAIYRQPKFK